MYYDSNYVSIVGTLVTEPKLENYILNMEATYFCIISSLRLSGTPDNLELVIPKYLMNTRLRQGTRVQIEGEIRELSIIGLNGKGRRKIYIYAFDVYTVNERIRDNNLVLFTGTLANSPVYRITPGRDGEYGREIADIKLAINNFDVSYYIPCIVWGNTAKFFGTVFAGVRVKLVGRIQSRKYLKEETDGQVVTKTAYEVSARKCYTI